MKAWCDEINKTSDFDQVRLGSSKNNSDYIAALRNMHQIQVSTTKVSWSCCLSDLTSLNPLPTKIALEKIELDGRCRGIDRLNQHYLYFARVSLFVFFRAKWITIDVRCSLRIFRVGLEFCHVIS